MVKSAGAQRESDGVVVPRIAGRNLAGGKDPDFDPQQRAFYYARVIEIPTPHWTCYDAKRFGVKIGKEVPMTHQERGYTSAIWYTPAIWSAPAR